MRTGRLIRFDAVKGFGFIAPDGGGEDVFLHVSALLDDASELRPGAVVEFEPIEGDQGTKALTARIVKGRGRSSSEAADDMCDVVPADELSRVITDVLITAAPSLTGAQILEVRKRLIDYARARRWLED